MLRLISYSLVFFTFIAYSTIMLYSCIAFIKPQITNQGTNLILSSFITFVQEIKKKNLNTPVFSYASWKKVITMHTSVNWGHTEAANTVGEDLWRGSFVQLFTQLQITEGEFQHWRDWSFIFKKISCSVCFPCQNCCLPFSLLKICSKIKPQQKQWFQK